MIPSLLTLRELNVVNIVMLTSAWQCWQPSVPPVTAKLASGAPSVFRLWPEQNGRYLSNDTFGCVFFKEVLIGILHLYIYTLRFMCFGFLLVCFLYLTVGPLHVFVWFNTYITQGSFNGPLARYVKLRVAHAPGMLRTFSPPPRFSDPDMHHGTCVAHVPWCMSGSLTSGFLWRWWRGRRSRHSRRMCNPQFCVSGKRPMAWRQPHDYPGASDGTIKKNYLCQTKPNQTKTKHKSCS